MHPPPNPLPAFSLEEGGVGGGGVKISEKSVLGRSAILGVILLEGGGHMILK